MGVYFKPHHAFIIAIIHYAPRIVLRIIVRP
jgi:hypothetical protein